MASKKKQNVDIDLSTPERARDHFLTVAVYTPPEIEPFRIDPHLVQHNALQGLEIVLGHKERIEKELPFANVAELQEIRPLTHAVMLACSMVNRAPEATTLREKMPMASALRRKLLAVASSLSAAGLIPEREVDAIRKGVGPVDHVTDLIQLPPLFRRHEPAIKGKHPLTKEDLDQSEALGAELLEILRPGSAPSKKPTNAELAKAVEERDRLWTLLFHRYDQLWRVGAWLFGRNVKDKVPQLMSRQGGSRRPKAGEPTEPEGPPEEPTE
jgi:hypothetical protein